MSRRGISEISLFLLILVKEWHTCVFPRWENYVSRIHSLSAYLSTSLPFSPFTLSLSLSLSFSLFLSLFLQYTYFSSIPDISWQYRREIDHCRYNCVIYGERRRRSHGKDNLIRKFKNHFEIRKYFVYNSLNIVYQKISKHTLLYFLKYDAEK